MSTRARSAGRRALDAAVAMRHRVRTADPDIESRITRLNARVDELERELTEARRMNRRLAELTDVVQELLLPLAQRDEDKLAAALQRYSAEL